MTKNQKLLVAVLSVAVTTVGGIYLYGQLDKAKKIEDNLFIAMKPTKASKSGANIIVNLLVTLTNYSGFGLTVQNMFTQLQVRSTGGEWVNAGLSTMLKSVTFTKDVPTNFNLPISVNLLTIGQKILSGGISDIRAITYFDKLGNRLSKETIIPISDFKNQIKNAIGLNGIGNAMPTIELTHIGNEIYAMI